MLSRRIPALANGRVLVAAGVVIVLLYFAFRGETEEAKRARMEKEMDEFLAKMVEQNKYRSFPSMEAAMAPLRNNPDCENGHMLLGKCFCDPGFTGSAEGCREKKPLLGPCNKNSDACFASDTGVCFIDFTRWKRAQKAESAAWDGNTGTSDRGDDHLGGFKNYASLPAKLGNFVELGCGPWTQSKLMFTARPDVTITSLTLWEPGINFYMQHTPTCSYKDGFLLNKSAILVQAGAEDLFIMREAYDSLMMINVLEHTQNMYVILQNIYDALKPGGILMFNDRWWDDFDHKQAVSLDLLYHPIRCYREVFDHFLSHFDTILMNINPPEVLRHYGFRNDGGPGGFYFVGRKKSAAAAAASETEEKA